MADQWYYTCQGQRAGPVALEQLRRAAADGKLRAADFIWKDGMTAWVLAGSVKGLFPPTVAAPSAAPSFQPADGKTILCSQCGQRNSENNFKCTKCGFLLHGPPPLPHVPTNRGIEMLIPYKNAQALWAYYLGVFSMIPCIGVPLGIAALILGVRGLKYSAQHPEAKGRAHAWAGIVLGSLCALCYILLIIIIGTNNRYWKQFM